MLFQVSVGLSGTPMTETACAGCNIRLWCDLEAVPGGQNPQLEIMTVDRESGQLWPCGVFLGPP